MSPPVAAWAASVPIADLYLSVLTVMEMETGALLIGRRDPQQGRLLNDWIERNVLRAFDGRILSIDRAIVWTVLTAKRWALLKLLAGKEPMSLRAVSRAAGRDVKGVHTDVHALVDAGILRRDEQGRITFPFDEVHVDFLLRAA
jgi:hypothetical protein